MRELVLDGAIGELEAVCAWGNRQIPRPGYLPAEGEPPKHLHYDLWLGPSPFHPYNPGYFAGGPGMNCLPWNMYWDFGSGQVGDMGSHTMDLAWNAIDAALPDLRRSQGRSVQSRGHARSSWRCTSTFRPTTGGPAIKVSWYQGGAMPESPTRMHRPQEDRPRRHVRGHQRAPGGGFRQPGALPARQPAPT